MALPSSISDCQGHSRGHLPWKIVCTKVLWAYLKVTHIMSSHILLARIQSYGHSLKSVKCILAPSTEGRKGRSGEVLARGSYSFWGRKATQIPGTSRCQTGLRGTFAHMTSFQLYYKLTKKATAQDPVLQHLFQYLKSIFKSYLVISSWGLVSEWAWQSNSLDLQPQLYCLLVLCMLMNLSFNIFIDKCELFIFIFYFSWYRLSAQ